MANTDLPTGSFGAVLRELAAAPDTAPRAPIDAGTVVGETLEVVRRLGAGGMGTVYLVRDRALGREVAIKVHSAVHAEEATLREAQVMAKVRHPNVVTVYEVGEHEGRVYVAMEYLAGGTLAEWLAAGPHPWREIVARFVAAGRGLAAAHAAGVIHRDFKPANVLFEDRRICVSDFGLAHDADGVDVTAGGGTPRFMAPERKDGQPGDARADQYSFCVALRDALAEAGPPGWLRALLARGTDDAPARRWPSLTALLDRIERGLGRRHRLARGAGLLVVAGGALTAGLALARTAPPDACGLPDDLDATWGPTRRAAVATTLATTAPDRAAGVVAALDTYLSGWSDAYRDTCRATRVRRAQSEQLLDARMACLAGRRARMGAVADLLADPSLAGWRVPDLVGQLEPVAACAQVERLGGLAPEPTDPARRAEIAGVRAELERVTPLHVAGRLDEVRTLLGALRPRARAAGYPPVLATVLKASAQFERARDDEAAAPMYEEAASVAIEAGAFDVAALALSQRAGQVARLGRYPEAEGLVAVARALAARTGDRALASGVENNAMAVYPPAKIDEARAAGRRALELAREALAPGDVQFAEIAGNRAAIEVLAGDFEAARPLFEESLELRRARLGNHPGTVHALRNLVVLAWKQHDLPRAERDPREALAMARRVGDQPTLTDALHVTAMMLGDAGQYAEADALYRELLDRWEREPGDRQDMADVTNDHARLLGQQGRHRDAAAEYVRAVARFDALLAPGHPKRVSTRSNIGRQLRLAGDLAGSAAIHREAVALATEHLAAGQFERVSAHDELAWTLLAQGQGAAAIALFEQVLAAWTERGDPGDLAWSRFGLARALVATGRARPRALALAAQAEQALAAMNAAGEPFRAEVVAWRTSIGAR